MYKSMTTFRPAEIGENVAMGQLTMVYRQFWRVPGYGHWVLACINDREFAEWSKKMVRDDHLVMLLA